MIETESKKKSEAKKIMYLGLGTAAPNEKNTNYKLGINYAVLIFAQAESFDDANDVAKDHMESTGWQEVVIDKMNPVDVNSLAKAPDEVMNAYEFALADGSHGMVLEAPK